MGASLTRRGSTFLAQAPARPRRCPSESSSTLTLCTLEFVSAGTSRAGGGCGDGDSNGHGEMVVGERVSCAYIRTGHWL